MTQSPKMLYFIKVYFIFWQDRTSDDAKIQHGGVLVCVQETLNEKDISPYPKFFHTILSNISSGNSSFVIACIYNPPKSNPYSWNLDTFLQFFRHVTNKQKSSEFNSIIFTGRNYFVGTDCKTTMHSSKAYENDCLNLFIELNFEQVFDLSDLSGTIKQLDVFLINELHLWIESNNDNTLGNQYKIGNAKRSDLLFTHDY